MGLGSPPFPLQPLFGGWGGDVWGCPYVGCSLHLQAKRKLDLEGPELCTPKGKGRTLAQVPSPRSKFGALERDGRWGGGGGRTHFPELRCVPSSTARGDPREQRSLQLCVLFQFSAWAQSSWGDGRRGASGVFLHQLRV